MVADYIDVTESWIGYYLTTKQRATEEIHVTDPVVGLPAFLLERMLCDL